MNGLYPLAFGEYHRWALRAQLPIAAWGGLAVYIEGERRGRCELTYALQNRARRGHNRVQGELMMQRHGIDRGIYAARRQ